MFEYSRHCNAKRLSKLRSTFDLLVAIRNKPLRKRNMNAIAKKYQFTEDQVSEIVGVTKRTYRKMVPNSRLSLSASERVIKLSELYEVGITTFENMSMSFSGWLRAPIPSLSNNKPIDLIFCDIGIGMVKDELIRMEYSVLG